MLWQPRVCMEIDEQQAKIIVAGLDNLIEKQSKNVIEIQGPLYINHGGMYLNNKCKIKATDNDRDIMNKPIMPLNLKSYICQATTKPFMHKTTIKEQQKT